VRHSDDPLIDKQSNSRLESDDLLADLREHLSDSKLEEELQPVHIHYFDRSIDILWFFYKLYYLKLIHNSLGDYVNGAQKMFQERRWHKSIHRL